MPWNFIVNGVLSTHLLPNRVRTQLLRLMGLKLHPKTIVRPKVFFRSSNITVGASTVIGYRTVFDTRQPLVIGKNVAIGPNVTFVDTDHEMSNPERRAGESVVGPIEIGDGCRVSTGTIILRGVTVGSGSAIGAAALVTANCEPHSLYVGIPARKIRDLPV
ncbi:maltose O-acetyltransferase [Rhodococcus pyridinivorans]|nr:maltose O-acetyltransferase [Rhodococcus pyridinivorans]